MKKKKNRKKLQISQILCFFSMFLAFYAINLSGFLSYKEREPLSDVTIVVIGVLTTVITSGYFGLSGIRDCSRNKLEATIHNKEDNDD